MKSPTKLNVKMFKLSFNQKGSSPFFILGGETMKRWIVRLLPLLLLFGFIQPVAAQDYRLFAEHMHVTMHVKEDGLVSVETTLNMFFNARMQGIYVELPIRYSDYNFEGLTGNADDNHKTYYLPVKNFKSSTHQKHEDSSGFAGVVYRLGTEGKYLEGAQTFKYSYDIQMRPLDLTTGEDYFFMNLVGDRWDFDIQSFSYEITFDKSIADMPIEVQAGYNNTVMDFERTDHSISGYYDVDTKPSGAVTILVQMGEDYFNFRSFDYTYIGFFLSIVLLLFTILMYQKHGIDHPVVQTVEFKPPSGINSAEVGYIYKGSISSENVVSLIIYWASEGYLTIEEISKKDIRLNKVKDMYIDNVEEKRLFDALFNNRDTVTTKELKHKFHTSVSFAQSAMPKRFTSNPEMHVFDKKSNLWGGVLTVILGVAVGIVLGLTLYSIFAIPMAFYIGLLFGTFAGIGIFIAVFALNQAFRSKQGASKFAVIIIFPIISLLFVVGLVGVSILTKQKIVYTLIPIIILLITSYVATSIPRRTLQGSSWYGHILGLKRFIETAEVNRLEAMVEETPYLFYNILPYAYVLGISDKWSKKFETIAMAQPDWYTTSTTGNFNSYLLWSSLNRNLRVMNQSMTSIPESSGSSGGGFGGGSGGGGGFSGGGFGGGGGGGW